MHVIIHLSDGMTDFGQYLFLVACIFGVMDYFVVLFESRVVVDRIQLLHFNLPNLVAALIRGSLPHVLVWNRADYFALFLIPGYFSCLVILWWSERLVLAFVSLNVSLLLWEANLSLIRHCLWVIWLVIAWSWVQILVTFLWVLWARSNFDWSKSFVFWVNWCYFLRVLAWTWHFALPNFGPFLIYTRHWDDRRLQVRILWFKLGLDSVGARPDALTIFNIRCILCLSLERKTANFEIVLHSLRLNGLQ